MRRIAILMLDGALTSGAALLADMLALSNRFIRRQYADREERGVTAETRLLSITGAPCRSVTGRRIEIEGSIADRQAYDLIYVAAFDVADENDLEERIAAYGPVRDWLRDQHGAGTIVAVSGSAIMLAAEAGLLDGLRIAAPWWLDAGLRHRHPRIEVDSGLEISDHGKVLCAAGMNGEPALAIRLVERLLSANVANWIAKLTLVRRAEASAETRPALTMSPLSDDPVVGRAQHWLQERFSEKPLMADLADFLTVSERTLTRRFEKSLGMAPLAYLQSLRIEVAKGMLTRSDQTIERIAYLVSYSDPKFFKQIFRNLTGLSPSAYRRQARTAASQSSASVSTTTGPART